MSREDRENTLTVTTEKESVRPAYCRRWLARTEYQPGFLLARGSECRCASEAWRRADKGDRAGHVAAWWMCGRRRTRRSTMVRTEKHLTGNCGAIRSQRWLLLLTEWDLPERRKAEILQRMRNCRSCTADLPLHFKMWVKKESSCGNIACYRQAETLKFCRLRRALLFRGTHTHAKKS